MGKFAFGSLLVLLCVSLNACTHVEYTRSWVNGEARIDPEESGPPVVDVEDFSVNEILLMDTSGIICAGVRTGLNEYSAASEARKKAIEARQTSYTYTYNTASPVAPYGGVGMPSFLYGLGSRRKRASTLSDGHERERRRIRRESTANSRRLTIKYEAQSWRRSKVLSERLQGGESPLARQRRRRVHLVMIGHQINSRGE